MSSIFTALSGLRAEAVRIDNAAHNIANLNTSGFRSRRLLQSTGPAGDHVTISETALSLSQGGLRPTGNPLNLAIDGQGFFQVSLPDSSTAYTRAGQFTTNSDGLVVDLNGNPLKPPISIPPSADNVVIDSSGQVSTVVDGSSVTLGSVLVATFNNPEGLSAIGNNLFKATSASGEPSFGPAGADGRGQMVSGFVEGSNVAPADQIIDLMVAGHSAAFNLKTIRAQDDLTKSLLNRP